MVHCSCGKAIDKVPVWLSSVNVEFVCNNCPKRQVKTIAQLQMEQAAAQAKLVEAEAAAKAAAELEEEE